MLKTCYVHIEKAPPFQPFQQRKVINTHINISCPHFVDYFIHFIMPIFVPSVHQKDKQHFSNIFLTWVIHILLINLCTYFARIYLYYSMCPGFCAGSYEKSNVFSQVSDNNHTVIFRISNDFPLSSSP